MHALPHTVARLKILTILTSILINPLCATLNANAASLGVRALEIAASKRGAPYKYGADGPHQFDCSGLAEYSFRRVGKKLPRTAEGQFKQAKPVSRHSRRAGDLVFFHSGRTVYHVGIYAENNKIWHSPKPGERVKLENIWTRNIWYGRVT
ncbi:C40 family peptidase [Streptomyces kronopolitis]